MDTKQSITAVGLMSGTSLDGLDMALVEFTFANDRWSFELLHSHTLSFPVDMFQRLQNAYHSSAFELAKLHHDYGVFCGQAVTSFLSDKNIRPELIASHGQTIFHRPDLGFTTQIGSAAAIAAIAKIDTIADFRSIDVALGGNGAPLVPLVDALLFSEYDACLNMGGFANVSYEENQKRFAFDICAANVVLNHLCRKLGKPYDAEGRIASEHMVNEELLSRLQTISYYQQAAPKSLGYEFVESEVFPILVDANLCNEVLIATYTTHVAQCIQHDLEKIRVRNVLVTGGGAYNTHLMNLLNQQGNIQYQLPSKEIIECKEAICFAFLGVLRKLNRINTLQTVTGAISDSIGGCIYLAS